MEYYRLTDEEFHKFSEYIHDLAGIYLKDTKITLLSNRLRKRLKERNFNSFNEYYKYLVTSNDATEIDEMLNVVSTNETYFFRNIKHFDALVDYIIPELFEMKKSPLKIWSAGCSTGEEPLTIAMALDEKSMLDKRYVEIYASDINTQVIDWAKRGIYDCRKLRTTPENYLLKYFRKIDENSYMIADKLRNYIIYSRINLKKDRIPDNIDIIFCRNVLIYFDKSDQKIVIDKFYDSLKDGGYLFIGHSESLYFIENNFRYKKVKDAPVYRKD